MCVCVHTHTPNIIKQGVLTAISFDLRGRTRVLVKVKSREVQEAFTSKRTGCVSELLKREEYNETPNREPQQYSRNIKGTEGP